MRAADVQSKIRMPETGQIVRFSVVPAGSYASVGTEYRVRRERAYVHLENVARGSGTSDANWAWLRAEWEVVS